MCCVQDSQSVCVSCVCMSVWHAECRVSVWHAECPVSVWHTEFHVYVCGCM